MIKNKFIAIEGLEGSGKTHACICIKNILKKHNITNVIIVRQPGGTPIAEEIRTIIKKKFKYDTLIKETELLLMYASRIQLIEKIIKPQLKIGSWIISDRHDLSSLAYQGGGLGIKEEIISTLKNFFFKDIFPDLTVYLDVSPKIGLRRASKRSSLDSIECRSLNFFKKTRKAYLKHIKIHPNTIQINANKNIKNVTKNINKKISNWIKKNIL